MEAFTDFLVSNYLWFLVISIILVFALIGYFVDQSEQKKGISTINKPKERELNIQDLAVGAANKSLNNAVSDAIKNSMPAFANPQEMSNVPSNNTITEVTNSQTQNTVTNPIGFDVLTK